MKGEKQDVFKDKLVKESMWDLDKDNVKMWNEMASCIKRVAKKVIGESKGCTHPDQEDLLVEYAGSSSN